MQAPKSSLGLRDALSQRLLLMKAKAQDQAQRGADLFTHVKAKANGVMNVVAFATAGEARRARSASATSSRRESSLRLLEEIRSLNAATKRSRSVSERRAITDETVSDSNKVDICEEGPSANSMLHWTISIDRTCGQPLGIDVDFSDGLQIQAVKAGNLVHAWNCQHPSCAVQAGDFVLEVNGTSSIEKMVAECQQLKMLCFLISRPDAKARSMSSSPCCIDLPIPDNATLAPHRPEPPAPDSVPQPRIISRNVCDVEAEDVEAEEVVLFEALSPASNKDVHKRLPALDFTSLPHSSDMSEVCQPVCDKASSGRGSLPESISWEWPLSRSEKKLRVELIDAGLWAMEQSELLKENARLRRRRKSAF